MYILGSRLLHETELRQTLSGQIIQKMRVNVPLNANAELSVCKRRLFLLIFQV
jgi:hypothetical protein